MVAVVKESGLSKGKSCGRGEACGQVRLCVVVGERGRRKERLEMVERSAEDDERLK